MSDPAKYRTREEVQKIREEKDPIDTLRSLLIEKYKISEKIKKSFDPKRIFNPGKMYSGI